MRDLRVQPEATSGGHGLPVGDLVLALRRGDSVLVTGPARIAALLDAATPLLVAGGVRVVRTRPPFDVDSFLKQVSPPGAPAGGTGLRFSFDSGGAAQEPLHPVVLLIEDAHLLPMATLRYLALALRFGGNLRAVLAGSWTLADTLAQEELAWLRTRLSRHLVLHAPVAAAVRARPWHLRATALAAGGIAVAGVALFLGVSGGGFSGGGAGERWPVTADDGFAAVAAEIAALPPVVAQEERAEPDVAPAADPRAADPPSADPPSADPPSEVAPVVEAVPPLPAVEPVPAAEPVPTPPPVAEAPAAAVAGLPAAPELVVPFHAAPRPVLPRAAPPAVAPARVAAAAPTPRPDERRCRDITMRVQIGEEPNDADRIFLRNGCR